MAIGFSHLKMNTLILETIWLLGSVTYNIDSFILSIDPDLVFWLFCQKHTQKFKNPKVQETRSEFEIYHLHDLFQFLSSSCFFLTFVKAKILSELHSATGVLIANYFHYLL